MKRYPIYLAFLMLLCGVAFAQAQTVTFKTYPFVTAFVDEHYRYDALAMTEDTASNPIEYSLSYGPSAMSVDSRSGLVSWTPTAAGSYAVEIRAALVHDPTIYATQNWDIVVTARETGGAAPFAVSGAPESQTVDGPSVEYTITVTASTEYTASVYLSASAPTLPAATIAVKPGTVNAPYPATSLLTITMTGPKTPGTHQIIIQGKNGPATARDTVTLTVEGRPAWQVFNTDNSPLTGNAVTAIVVDQNDVAWMAVGFSAMGGTQLMSYDGTTWTHYDAASSYPYAGSGIRGIAIDSSNALWVATTYGLATFDGTTWRGYALPSSLRGYTSHMKLAMDNAGNAWIAARDELLKFDGTGFTSYPIGEPDAVAVDHQGRVWCGDIMGKKVSSFDGTYWTTYEGSDYPGGHPRSIAVHPDDGSVHVICDSYGVRFSNGTVTTYGGRSESFPGPELACIAFDNNGVTWAGSAGFEQGARSQKGGLIRYDGTDSWYYSIGNSGLPNRDICAIFADRNGNIWIGTQEGGLAILDGSAPAASLFSIPLSVSIQTSSAMTQRCLRNIWPNPAQNRALVDLDIPTRSHARLSLMNAIGEEIAVTLDTDLEAGHRQIPVDLENLAAGTYFLHLEVGGRVEAQPLIVTR